MKRNNQILAAILIIGALAVFLWSTGALDTLFNQTIAGTKLTVTLEDGSTVVFDSKDHIGMTLTLPSGGVVSSMKLELYAKPTFYGTVASYTVTGSLRWQIRHPDVDPYAAVYDTGKVPLTPLSPKPALVNGSATVLASSTVSAAEVEGLIPSKVNGDHYTLWWTNPDPVTMTITFTDGNEDTRVATAPTCTLTLQYTTPSGFTGLTVVFQHTP